MPKRKKPNYQFSREAKVRKIAGKKVRGFRARAYRETTTSFKSRRRKQTVKSSAVGGGAGAAAAYGVAKKMKLRSPKKMALAGAAAGIAGGIAHARRKVKRRSGLMLYKKGSVKFPKRKRSR